MSWVQWLGKGLETTGDMLTGFSAPFVGDYEWRKRQLQQQQSRASMEKESAAAEQLTEYRKQKMDLDREKFELEKRRYEETVKPASDAKRDLYLSAIKKYYPEIGGDSGSDFSSPQVQSSSPMMANIGSRVQAPMIQPAMSQAPSINNPSVGAYQPLSGLDMSSFPRTQFRMGGSMTSPKLEQTEESAVAQDIWKDVSKERFKEKTKKQEALQTQLTGTQSFLKQFGRSYKELIKAYPDIGKVGVEGLAERTKAMVGEKLGNFPETTAFLRELEPRANQMARDIEGGRITDQDRAIYAKSFASVIRDSSATNIRLASNSLIEARNKGGNIDKIMSELKNSEVGIMKEIYKQVKESEESSYDDKNVFEGL